MTVSSNYYSNFSPEHRRKQQNFGNALAPVVGFATFIENNGFLGEFLTVDTAGMGAPRTIQGYNRNKEELGHLNYKAGREEMVREVLSGPAFFFIPAGILTLAALLRGKATKITTDNLDAFKDVMKNASKGLKNKENSREIREKFLDEFMEKGFSGYKNNREQVAVIRNILSEMSDSPKNAGPFSKARKDAKTKIANALTILNKSNGKFLDNTTSFKIGDNEMDIVQMVSDVPNYLENFSKAIKKNKEPMEKFVESFHKKAKLVRQFTNIAAAAAVAVFLVEIPKLYQTDKKFPGLEGLNTNQNGAKPSETKPGKETKAPKVLQTQGTKTDDKKDSTNQKSNVSFSGAKPGVFDWVSKQCNVDSNFSFTRQMFFVLSVVFMLGSRVFEARGDDEKREILTRDVPAIALAAYGAPMLNRGISALATKATGIPTMSWSKDKDGKVSKSFATQKQVKDWYSDFEHLKDPLLSLSETVHKNGGNISRVMNRLGLSKDLKQFTGKENATNEEILKALKDAKGKKAFVELENKLKKIKGENDLSKLAKNVQGSIKVGSILLTAAILGYLLPRLNIITTRKKYQNKQQENQNNVPKEQIK